MSTVAIPPISLPSRARFDYAPLDHDLADRLRTQAGNIRERARTTMVAIIEIGAALIEAKGQLDHGQFTDWVQAECGFTIRTAENYISAAKFADGKNETVALLPPASVYRLAEKRTPVEVVETVLARAEAGEVVAGADIDAMLVESRHRIRQQDKKKKTVVSARTWRRHEQRREKEKEEAARRAAEAEVTAQQLLGLVDVEVLRTIVRALDNWDVRVALAGLLEKAQTEARS